MAATTTFIETLAHACGRLQASPKAVREALREVGAEPVLVVNELAHYAEEDMRRIAERLRDKAGRRASGNGRRPGKICNRPRGRGACPGRKNIFRASCPHPKPTGDTTMPPMTDTSENFSFVPRNSRPTQRIKT